MIVSDKFEFVYIDTPKTGSISFERLFKEKFDGYVVYPTNNKNLTKHCREIPKHAQNYQKIISVRNPYDRLKSLYSYHLQRLSSQKDSISIDEFLDKIIKERKEYQKNRFLMYLSIDDYLSPFSIEASDCVVQLENVTEQINDLPFVKKRIELPWRNRSSDTTKPTLASTTINKVNIWAANDFNKFGYKKIA